ncbi:MAG TPA: hypothetical protein VLE43_10285 [Candidatus Saccharimonadia bacterium]|nr:hypothetical protein [Candidatus Saccharimonadia bacterium]
MLGMLRGVTLMGLMVTVGVALSSCVILHERDGEGKSATYASLGGKGAYRKGYGVVHNHEKSFRDGAVLAGTLATSYFGAVTAKATEVTSQVALKEATRKHASDNALKGQAIEANAAAHSQAIGAELPGTLPAAPPPSITP